MKCPKCGREIPDGSLFCKYCFADIKIVPTYESNVEEKLNDVMSDIKTDVVNQKKHEEERAKTLAEFNAALKKVRKWFFVGIGIVILLVAVVFFVNYRHNHSEEYFLAQAEDLASKGYYIEAADEIQEGMRVSDDSSPALMLARAGYLEKAGRYEEAEALSKLVIASSASTKEDIQKAYGTIIAVYQDQQEYDKINEMLLDCGDTSVQEMYSEYMVYEPEFTPASGSYEGAVSVTIRVTGDSSIFYAMSSRTPTTEDSLYTDAIILGPGSYTITAVAVNHFGIVSDPVTVQYVVTEGSLEEEDSASDAATGEEAAGQ